MTPYTYRKIVGKNKTSTKPRRKNACKKHLYRFILSLG